MFNKNRRLAKMSATLVFLLMFTLGMANVVFAATRDKLPDSVTTGTATCSVTTAVINGSKYSSDGKGIDKVGVLYSKTKPLYYKLNNKPVFLVGNASSKDKSSPFDCNLTSLSPNTTYYYCAYVKVGNDYKFGETLSFKTLAKAGECLVTYQGVQKKTNSDGTYDIRFIATIDTLDADSVGFVFSRSKLNPTKDNSQVISTTTVYDSIVADGSTKTAASLGGKYIIACTVAGIPKDQVWTPLYVRAFSTKDSVTTYTSAHTIIVYFLK